MSAVATSKGPPVAAGEAITEARVQLAAALRMAVLDDLVEGIDNHFTVQVPGGAGQYLILPFGLHWSQARASDLVVFDESGATLEGEGRVEISARCIHAPIHRITGAQAVLHTHQPYATALNLLADNRLLPASQSAAFLTRLVAYDNDYAGLAHTVAEGERLAHLAAGKPIVFMKNHGVLVMGDTIAQAYHRISRLERVCRLQLLAMGSGQPLALLPEELVDAVRTPNAQDTHSRAERERLFFEAMMRVVDRELPGYRD